jgi:arsenite/tail-anchored protein-transporting ATPase
MLREKDIYKQYSQFLNMFLDKKLILFGGKGGVGKTTCAAATALHIASQGKKTLILSTDPAHSLSDSFEQKIGNTITNIKDNLDALEIDAASLLKTYKKRYGELIKQIADEGTFFSKGEIQEFFDLSLPGMDELMALVKIIDILGEGNYEVLILDTAPTGHTIRFLESPDVLTAYVKVLSEMRQKHKVVVSMMVGRYIKDKADEFLENMHKNVENIRSILQDATMTSFVIVTIPEAMSVYETEKLVQVLERHHIPIDTIVVNGMMQDYCAFCASRMHNQEQYIEEIMKKLGKYDIKEIPLFPYEIQGKQLETFSKHMFGEESESQPPKQQEPVEMPPGESLKIKHDLEFILFGGKGGVGKTSCAAAVALHESKHKKVLLFSTDPAHSLSDSFEQEIGDSITAINDNLDALEIDADKLLNALKERYKKEIHAFFSSVFKQSGSATIDAPYDRKVMEDLFDLRPPGIDEIMALQTMMELMKKKKYDLFILDTAPSGHTIRLLELPEIAEAWVRTLSEIVEKYPISFEIGDTLNDMLDTIKNVRKVLTNTEKTEFVIVTIPEAMGVLETQDVLERLHNLKMPTTYMIINKIIPATECNFCRSKRIEQSKYIKKLKELQLKIVPVELFEKEIKGEDLHTLSKVLFTP